MFKAELTPRAQTIERLEKNPSVSPVEVSFDYQAQWFQIALRTYFWAGFLFAAVFATSLVCLVATKYYHDQAVLQHNAMERDFRSYRGDLDKARDQLREVGKAWYAIEELRKKLERESD